MLMLAVSDGRAGNRRQAEALAAALAARLGADWSHYLLAPRQPWKALAPRWLPMAPWGFDPGWLQRLDADRPALVIGCGRQAALATRIARRRLGAATRCVQILDPRLGRNVWDLLVLPEHDRYRDADTLTCTGSLHAIDEAWLESARERHHTLGMLPSPRLALLLGGPTADCRWNLDHALDWIGRLHGARRTQGGSALLVGSPRTPPAWREALRQAAAGFELCWLDGGDGDNPYAGVLAWADRLIVSPDSANLLSEACATTAEVLLPARPAQRGRIGRLHARLLETGRVRPLDAEDRPAAPVTPLRETARIAGQILERLGPALARAARPDR